MRKFFTKIENTKVIFLLNDYKHLKVLRVKKNDILECFNSENGDLIKVQITQTNPYIGNLIEIINKNNLKPYDITCFLGVIKKNNFEWAIEKLNELNIKKTYPVFFDFSQQNIVLNYERLNKMIDESCKQSNRFLKMELSGAISFNEMIELFKEFDLIVVAYEKETTKTLDNIKNDESFVHKKIAFIIGPEGGFSKNEINILKKETNSIKLTNTILKAETAAIYCASILIERFYNEN